MHKELLVFDVDDTLILGQSQMLFIQYVYKIGLISTFDYAQIIFGFLLYKLRITKDPKSVMELGLSFFVGKSITELDVIIRDFFKSTLRNRFVPQLLEIIKKAKDNGDDIVLASNAIHPIIKVIGDYLGVANILCTQVGSNSGVFSGTIEGKLMYGVTKLDAVKYFIEKKGERYQKTWVYTDHHSDVPLLEWATDPVVVNPDRVLLKKARVKGWQIIIQ